MAGRAQQLAATTDLLKAEISKYKDIEKQQQITLEDLRIIILQQRKDAGGLAGPQRAKSKLQSQLTSYEAKLIRTQETLALSRQRGSLSRSKLQDLSHNLNILQGELQTAKDELSKLTTKLDEMKYDVRKETAARDVAKSEIDEIQNRFAREKELWKIQLKTIKDIAKMKQKSGAIMSNDYLQSQTGSGTDRADRSDGDQGQRLRAASGSTGDNQGTAPRGNVPLPIPSDVPANLKQLLSNSQARVEYITHAFQVVKKLVETQEKYASLKQQMKKLKDSEGKQSVKTKTMDEELRIQKDKERRGRAEMCTIAKSLIIAFNSCCRLAKLIDAARTMGMPMEQTSDTRRSPGPNGVSPQDGIAGMAGTNPREKERRERTVFKMIKVIDDSISPEEEQMQNELERFVQQTSQAKDNTNTAGDNGGKASRFSPGLVVDTKGSSPNSNEQNPLAAQPSPGASREGGLRDLNEENNGNNNNNNNNSGQSGASGSGIMSRKSVGRAVLVDSTIEDFNLIRKMPAIVPSYEDVTDLLGYLTDGTSSLVNWTLQSIITGSGGDAQPGSLPASPTNGGVLKSKQGDNNTGGDAEDDEVIETNFVKLYLPVQFTRESVKLLMPLNLVAIAKIHEEKVGVQNGDMSVDQVLKYFNPTTGRSQETLKNEKTAVKLDKRRQGLRNTKAYSTSLGRRGTKTLGQSGTKI